MLGQVRLVLADLTPGIQKAPVLLTREEPGPYCVRMGAIQWSKSACAGLARQDPEKYDQIFFPRGRPRKKPYHEQYCSNCPIVNSCLAFAVVHNMSGVWGNYTTTERNLLANQKVGDQTLREVLLQQAQEEGWFDPVLLKIEEEDQLFEVLEEEFLPPLEELEFPGYRQESREQSPAKTDMFAPLPELVFQTPA